MKDFLSCGSVVIYKENNVIGKAVLGILRLDNDLIILRLDGRLCSINSFLRNGNNWGQSIN